MGWMQGKSTWSAASARSAAAVAACMASPKRRASRPSSSSTALSTLPCTPARHSEVLSMHSEAQPRVSDSGQDQGNE